MLCRPVGRAAASTFSNRSARTSCLRRWKFKLFGRHHTLILYSFMYGPEREAPCPMCTHLLDSVNGAARHVSQRAWLYIVAKSPIARLVAWARERGWDDLDSLSTAGSSYDAD